MQDYSVRSSSYIRPASRSAPTQSRSRPPTAVSALDRAHAFLRGERRDVVASSLQNKPASRVHQRSLNFAVDRNDDSSNEDPLEEDESDGDSADELQEYLSSLAKKKLTAASVATTSARAEMPSQPSPRAAASGYLKRLPTTTASPALHRIPTLGSPAPVPAAEVPAVLRLPPYTRSKEATAIPVKDNGGSDVSSDESLGSDFESFLRSPTKRPVVQVTDPVEQSPTRSRASTPSPPVPPGFALSTKPISTAFAVADHNGPSAAVYTPRSSKSTYDHVARASSPSPALNTPIRKEEPAARASLVRTPDYPPAATPPSTRAAPSQHHASPADHIAARLSPSPIRSGLSTPKRFHSAETLSHTRFPSRRASLSPTRHSRSNSFSSSVSPLHQLHHHASRPGAGPPSLRHSVAGSAPRSPSRLSVAHTFAAPIPSADPAIEKVSQAKSQPAPPAGPTNLQMPPPPAFLPPGTYSAPAAYPPSPAQHPAPYPAAYGYPPYPYLYPPPLAAWGPGPAHHHHVCSCKSSSRSSADSESNENRSSTSMKQEKEKRRSRSKHRRQRRRRAPSPPTETDAEKPHSRTESHDHHRSRHQHHHHRRHRRRRSHHRRRDDDDSPLAPPEPPPAADIDPNLAFLHTLMSGHLAYVKAFVASHFAAADCVESRRKRYMTLADTKKFIKENACPPMSFAEAVRKVDEEQLGLQS
ncbi:hypothetical protein HDU88_003555 [Geranomyces variabilis]|nr:hypothetical protein HDU88_003555 [Geranomyces variabilis]